MTSPTDAGKPSNAEDASSATPSPEFHRAASLLSIWGPCREVGDAYLSCVVTAGMGMCKPLRRNFEQCTTETSEYSMLVLDQLGMQACGHVDDSTGPIAKRNCAADFLLQQHQMQQQQQLPPQGPPPS